MRDICFNGVGRTDLCAWKSRGTGRYQLHGCREYVGKSTVDQQNIRSRSKIHSNALELFRVACQGVCIRHYQVIEKVNSVLH